MELCQNAKLYKEGAIFIFTRLSNETCKIQRIATLYFAARQAGHKRGNTCNKGFQFAMQQCCETS